MHAANCLILDCITKFILLNLLAHYNPVQLVSDYTAEIDAVIVLVLYKKVLWF
jgi:hypothetical protein